MTVPRKRIYELARAYKISSNAMVQFMQELGFEPKSHMSVATPEMIDAVRNKFNQERQDARQEMAHKSRIHGGKVKVAEKAPVPVLSSGRKVSAASPKPTPAKAAPIQAAPVAKAAPVEPNPVKAPQVPSAPAKPVVTPPHAPKVQQKQPVKPTQPKAKPAPQGQLKSAPQGQLKPATQGQHKPAQKRTEKTLVRKPTGQAPPPKAAAPGTKQPTVKEVMRRLEKKQKKKERRKKRSGRVVNQADVARSFKATMANLSGVKTKKKYKKDDSGEIIDGGPTNVIEVSEYMSVAEIAKLMDIKPVLAVTKLFEMGMMATINQRLDMDTIQMLASEYEFETKEIEEVGDFVREEEIEENLVPVAPVVTIMGHVDHGKTSLLDYIRKSNVVGGEAGAITQHIGAYEVNHNDNRIVFLDTPGHEAFTAMRARGAQITDIVIVVVAADEAVKPQTIEAIDHARAANVPIIVAITKIDKPNANADQVRTQLTKHNLMDEQWGGKTIMAEISAKTGEGIDNLLDMILLQAEMLDKKADPIIRGQGIIIDSRLEKGRGPVATVLIQRGTCRVGDPIVAGVYSGNVRTMVDDREKRQKEAGPSTPVQITGLNGVPQAGDSFLVVKDAQEGREITLTRAQLKRVHESRRPSGVITLEKVFDQIKEGQISELRLVVKGDVDGSVEVLADTLGKLSTDEVKTNIIRRGVGGITESDVLLAATSEAIIIGFHVAPDSRARETARREKVDIRQYSVIYEVEDDIKKALEGMLAPSISEKLLGAAEVRDVFRIPKMGTIAGSYVKEGLITRNGKARLLRDGTVVYEGKISSLRRFKDDAKEVKEGFECGIGIENFNDVKVGDIIEAYEIVETARTLE